MAGWMIKASEKRAFDIFDITSKAHITFNVVVYI